MPSHPPNPTEPVPRGGSRPSAFITSCRGGSANEPRLGTAASLGGRFGPYRWSDRLIIFSVWVLQLLLSIVPFPAPALPPLVPGDHLSHLKVIPFATACLECARDFSLALASSVCKKRVETGWPEGQSERGTGT